MAASLATMARPRLPPLVAAASSWSRQIVVAGAADFARFRNTNQPPAKTTTATTAAKIQPLSDFAATRLLLAETDGTTGDYIPR